MRMKGCLNGYKKETMNRAPAAAKTHLLNAFNQPLSPVLARLFKTFAGIGFAIVLAISIISIVGYACDIEIIKHPFPHQPSLQSGTTIAFLFASCALLMLYPTERPKVLTIAAKILGAIVAAAGLVNFLEHSSGQDWSLSFPLWQSPNATPLSFPGPIAPDVSVMFMLLGAAIVLLGFDSKHKFSLYQVVILFILLPNLMILGCYGFGEPHICGFFGCLKFSPITAFVFATTSFSALLARPTEGITGVFAADTTGGDLARYIAVCLLPVVPMLALIKTGSELGYYDTIISNGMMALLFAVVVAGGVMRSIKKVDSLEAEKSEIVEKLSNSLMDLEEAQKTRLKSVCLICLKEFEDPSLTTCPDDGSELQQIMDELKPGSTFAGNYEIQNCLGAGGMSAVYLAKHKHMDTLVAVKLVHAQFASDPKYVQRFKREAQATRLLVHPNIAQTHDFGITGQGLAYLIMDYIEGVNLGDRVEAVGALGWQEAVPLFLQICEGLKFAHEHNVVHRDLKPANVMLATPAGKQVTAKIVDFGLAKAHDLGSQKLTRTGEVLGSPIYMSPEQCRGESVDLRSDIYSMGILMYEVLTSEPPFVGTTIFDTLNLQIAALPPEMPKHLDVPKWLQLIVFKALEKIAEFRQPTVQDLINELQAGLKTETSSYLERLERTTFTGTDAIQ